MRWMMVLAASASLLLACEPRGEVVGRGLSSAERVATLRARLAARPDDPALLTRIGAEHAALGQWDAAAGAYREALLVEPRHRAAALGYGRALVGGGRYGQARAQATAALSARDDREARMLLGVALAAEGRVAEAVAQLEAARAGDPRDLAARANLALALALGRDPRAYALMRQVAFAPDADPRHRRNLVLVGGMLGLDEQARADAARLGIGGGEAAGILRIGRRARTEGARAFGVASAV